MNNGTVGSAQIRIDADTASAVKGLQQVGRELDGLVPGGNAVASVFERIQGGALQLVQGLSRNMFKSITQSMTKVVSAGVDTAKTMEMAKVAFDNLLESGENVDDLLNSIQENATKTPFDTDALTLSTQKLALITKNGAQAQSTVLALGKALAAAGRGTAEMNRMATNLQQIGQNAKATERDLREFGNAGVDIVGIVAKFSDEFKESGLKVTKARDWLKSISDPYTVISNALIKAGNDVDGFAKIYEDGAMTIGQALENMSDSISIFGYRVLEQSGVLTKFKGVLKEFQEGLFLDHTFVANTAKAIEHLIDKVRELDIVRPIIEGIKKVVSAFATGQFDNVIVFFKNLFNAIKQFSGLKVISNFFKTIFDLFSDNHTAEEVAKVATQIGNLVRVFLELKLAMSISNYAYRLTSAFLTVYQSLSVLIPQVLSFATSMGVMKTVTLGVIGVIAALVGGIALFANVSGGSFQSVIDSIVSGFRSIFETLGNAVKNMASFGWNLIVGLYNGLVEGFKAVIGKIKEMAQAIIDTFARVFQIHSPSKVMRDYIGHNIMLGIIAGINDMRGEVAAAVEEVKEELVKLQVDYVKELNEFGALDLVEQVRVYKEFASLYAKGTRARLEMDDKVHDAETAITKEMISLIEDFNKAFDKAFLSAKNYYDMFEYTQITLTRTTKSVIEGLRRQNDNMEKYYKNLYQMSQMGFDEDFMSYVYDQGMDAASEVAGLSQATAEQIEEINEMWRTRGKIATDIAVLNTKKLKEETLDELGYLQTGLETKVLDYYDSGTYLMYQFTRGIYDMMPTVEDAMYRVAASASKSTKKAADDALKKIDTTPLSDALNGAEDFTAAARRMEVQMYDTADAFSFIKNLLSGIPWWGWALGAGAAIVGVIKKVQEFKNGLNGAKKTAQLVGDAVTGSFKQVMTETFGFTGQMDSATVTLKNGADKTSQVYSKMSKDIQGNYSKTVETTRKASKQINDITYSSAGKTGANLLRPFKTFNTRIKGIASSITNFINEFLNIIFATIQNFVRQVMNIIAEITGGLGRAIKALLEPLSDAKLFLGVGVLAALAATLWLLAQAGRAFAEVEWESLGKMAVVTVGLIAVAAVMIGIGAMADKILMGALAVAAAGVAIGVATAAIGLGMATLAQCLTQVGELGENINIPGIFNIIGAIAAVSAVLAAMSGIIAVGAVGAVFAAVLGGGLLLATMALAQVNEVGRDLTVDGFWNVIGAIGVVSTALALMVGVTTIGAISGLFAALIGVEFIAITAALSRASELSGNIDIGKLWNVSLAIGIVSTALAVTVISSIIGALSGLFAALISVEFLVIAASLAKASELSGAIDIDKLNKVKDAVVAIANALAANVISSIIGALSGAFAAAIGVEFLAIAASLAKASEVGAGIKLESLLKVGVAILAISNALAVNVISSIIGAVSGAFAAAIAVELMAITASLVKVSEEADKIDTSKFKNIQKAIDELGKINFGDFWKNLGNSTTSAQVKDVAKNVEEIVACVVSTCFKLEEIKNVSEQSIDEHLAQISRILEKLTTIDYGNKKGNDEKKKASEKLADVTKNVEAIISTVTNAVGKLAELVQKYGRSQVDTYIEQIQEILEKVSSIQLTDEKKDRGIGSKTELDKTKEAAKKIAELSEQVSKIMDGVKNIVTILADFNKSGVSPEMVKGYVNDTRGIIEQFANIKVEQNVEDSVKENVKKIAEVAENVAKIIESAKKTVETLKGLNDAGITSANVAEKVGEANDIVAKFGELALPEKTDDAYKKLSENTGYLATAVGKVNEILTSAKAMVDLVEQYQKAIEGKNVDEMVKKINLALAQIAGGTDEDGTPHEGIHLPTDTYFSETDVNALTQVKNALDKISEIATALNNTPEVSAEKIGGVTTIINFVKDTLSQLPKTLQNFEPEFKGVGERYANAFKQGWESSYPTLTQIGQEAALKVCLGVTDKHNAMKEQGSQLADKFLEGWTDRVNSSARAAGENMQGKLWDGIESKMQDEFYQGDALAKQLMAGFASDPESWKNSGGAMVEGIGVGINNNMWRISSAVGNISQTAITRLKQLLDIHSPSKVMAELGGYVAEGFADGITDQLQEVENAGEALAEAVMDGYNDAIQPLELSAFEARAVADQESYGRGYVSRSTSVVQNNNIYNNMDMSQALGQIAWEVSRS